MNSVPERFTPWRRCSAPDASTILLPETWSLGAVVAGVVVVGVAVGVGVGDGDASVLQATPLSLKAVGAGFEPDQSARKPALTLPPVAITPFQLSLTTVTLAPDWDHLPLQPWVTFWVPGKSKVRVQLLVAALLLVMTTLPWNPVLHWFVTE